MRASVAPAVLRPLAGVRYREFAALAAPLEVVRGGEVVGSAHAWIDGLETTDAEPLLAYRHELFGRWAAATHRSVGSGSITVVGTLLDRQTLADLVSDIAGPVDRILAARPSSVTAHSLASPRGRVWVVHNWSPTPSTVGLALAAASVIDGTTHEAGSTVELGPWDVRVWREA